MKKLIIFAMVIFFITVVLAQPIEEHSNITENGGVIIENGEAICVEKLKICVDLYEELLMDFKEGVNCGVAFGNLKYFNEVLTGERDSCREEIGELKSYKVGFFIMFVLFILLLIFYFRLNLKKGDDLNKKDFGVKNAGERRKDRKDTKKKNR